MRKDGDILIIGRGQCPHDAAAQLAHAGVHVLWAVPEEGSVTDGPNPPVGTQVLRLKRLMACEGQDGDFEVMLDSVDNGGVTCHVRCILVATEKIAHPNYRIYGLPPCSRVASLSEFEKVVAAEGRPAACAPQEKILFLNGWQPDSHPDVAARMLQLCLQLQKAGGAQTFFFTGNLKVSMEGMERAFQDAKAAGGIFVRSNRPFPALELQHDGRVAVHYFDEVTRGYFQLTADRTIIDESLAADPFLSQAAEILRLESDADGFLQKDNVRRLSHHTNRKGIFVADAARAFLPQSDLAAEAKRAALCVWHYLSPFRFDGPAQPISVDPSVASPAASPVALIDQSACARCLTCYRLCPYAAIGISPRMEIHPTACQGCGLCRAGCPNRAIRLDGSQIDEMIAPLPSPAVALCGGGPAKPRIVAFCCRRSAAQSHRLSACAGYRLPEGMVIVEGHCGGTLSVYDLVRSFEEGADGVMVLTCHDGNCHSGTGSASARSKVFEASKCLSLAGISSERIHYSTLASNMMFDFARRTGEFAQKIHEMGPLKIV